MTAGCQASQTTISPDAIRLTSSPKSPQSARNWPPFFLEIRNFVASSISACLGLPGFGDLRQAERVHGEDRLAEGDQRVGVEAGLALVLVVEDRRPGIGFLGRTARPGCSRSNRSCRRPAPSTARSGLRPSRSGRRSAPGVPISGSRLVKVSRMFGPVLERRGRDGFDLVGRDDGGQALADHFPAIIVARAGAGSWSGRPGRSRPCRTCRRRRRPS